MQRREVIAGVSNCVVWWIGNRRKKLVELSHESMAVNPFLAPLMLALSDVASFEELAGLLLAGHFSVGHATGFGKLIDEKMLPKVFGTTKLDTSFRRKKPWSSPIFDEVDHIVERDDGRHLLSLKAGRWTIQLTMAVQLNKAFVDLVKAREEGDLDFEGIVVGVFYGTVGGLTDKYDIIRGINRGKYHAVTDLRDEVTVYAGREFWAWLNEGELDTQEWVMEGILEGIDQAHRKHGPIQELVRRYEERFAEGFREHTVDGRIDWHGILRMING